MYSTRVSCRSVDVATSSLDPPAEWLARADFRSDEPPKPPSSMSSMSKSRSKKLKTSFTASAQTPLASASSSKGVVAPSSSATGTALLKISELERRLTSSGSQGADLNPLVDLLDYVRQPGTSSKVLKVRTAAAHALHNAFSSLVRQGRLLGKIKDGSNGAQEKEAAASALKAVREWAKARWNDYLENLCGLLCTSEPEEETLSVSYASTKPMLPPSLSRSMRSSPFYLPDHCSQHSDEPPENHFRAPICPPDPGRLRV